MARGRRSGLLARLGSARGGDPRAPAGEAGGESRPEPTSAGDPPAPAELAGESARPEATTERPASSPALSAATVPGLAPTAPAPGPAASPATEKTHAHAGDGARAVASEIGSEARPTRTSPITADPAPLGLAAFALTTLVLSLFNSGLLPEAGEPVVFGLAFAYGGLAQLLAGMWEFRTGNTFGATAFTSYGAFWISFALLEVFFADQIPEADLELYLGWTLIAWALFTSYMYIASFKVTGAVNVVFLLLAATFYLLGLGDVTGTEIVTKIGGFLGIVTAFAAWYASFAIVTNETFRQKVLPVKELD
jgi:succinate-acetate transporter protein